MMNIILVLGLGIPAAFVLLNFIVFQIFTRYNFTLTREFKDITAGWVGFMERGIPIPSDYVRIEQPFEGQPVLIQPEYEFQKTETAA